MPRLPLMKAIGRGAKGATPVPLCRVAGASNKQHVASSSSPTDNASQLFVDRSAAFAIAPARHNQRARYDPRPLIAGPADCLQEFVGTVVVPIGKEKVGLGSQRVNDLTTKNAVLTVFRFEVMIGPKGGRGHRRWKDIAEKLTV